MDDIDTLIKNESSKLDSKTTGKDGGINMAIFKDANGQIKWDMVMSIICSGLSLQMNVDVNEESLRAQIRDILLSNLGSNPLLALVANSIIKKNNVLNTLFSYLGVL